MKTITFTFLCLATVFGCSSSNFSSSGSGKALSKVQKDKGSTDDSPSDNPLADSSDETSTPKGKGGNDGDIDGDDNEVVDGSETDSANQKDPLLADFDEEFSCDKGQDGYIGKVFRLPNGQPSLPDFETMTPVGQVESLELNVPDRNFTAGFPGVPNLIEWFGIEFQASLEVPNDGSYTFKTVSDDGSKLYVDKQLIVNNDGTHSNREIIGAPVTLKKGKHVLRVDWFQGPKTHIALQVFWQPPGQPFTIVPATALKHGKGCNLQDLGSF